MAVCTGRLHREARGRCCGAFCALINFADSVGNGDRMPASRCFWWRSWFFEPCSSTATREPRSEDSPQARGRARRAGCDAAIRDQPAMPACCCTNDSRSRPALLQTPESRARAPTQSPPKEKTCPQQASGCCRSPAPPALFVRIWSISRRSCRCARGPLENPAPVVLLQSLVDCVVVSCDWRR